MLLCSGCFSSDGCVKPPLSANQTHSLLPVTPPLPQLSTMVAVLFEVPETKIIGVSVTPVFTLFPHQIH